MFDCSVPCTIVRGLIIKGVEGELISLHSRICREKYVLVRRKMRFSNIVCGAQAILTKASGGTLKLTLTSCAAVVKK